MKSAKPNAEAESVSAYSRSQKKYWQRVPFLALYADGRRGFSEAYQLAYEHGMWPALMEHGDYGSYQVYVDLATGELMDWGAIAGVVIDDAVCPTGGKPRKATVEQLLRLATRMHELDAAGLVKQLEKEAKAPYGEYYSEEERERNEKRRSELQKELKLGQAYRR